MTAIRPEIGNPGNIDRSWRRDADTGGARSAFTPRPEEHTWELEWPLNMAVYNQMRRSDGQVGSLLKAIRLPIQSANWSLSGDDVRPEVMDLVEKNLGLEPPGEHRRRRRRAGIVWRDHVREALLMLAYGNVFFEQVYYFTPSDPTHIHLRKLALRLPTTIREIEVGRDGGLAGIWQESVDETRPEGVFIPVDRLVAYVLDREGGDWTGQSILRTAYKHWLIADHLMRIDAQVVERNGMGIPVLTYDPSVPSARESAEQIVEEVRAGEAAGIALPVGDGLGKFELVGVSGQTVDAIPRIQYHNQQISRSALAMFLDLGHDAGARSLGETQEGFFLDSVQAVADGLADVATEHIIRDLVEINFGPDEAYPVLSPGRIRDNGAVNAEALSTLATSGIITPDRGLEKHVRARYGLPETSAQDPVAPVRPAQDFIAASGADRIEQIVARLAELGHVR